MLSPLSLSQLAHHSAPAGIPVAASPCTSPQRRTGATPHSPHAQCGRMACGSKAAKAQSRRPCNPSTCTCHATASPQRASFQRPACHGCIVCGAIVCRPVRARAIGSFRTHDDDDTAFPQKRGEVLPYEAHHAPCTGACPPDGTRPDAIPPAPASPVSPELRPSTHLSSCPTCPRLTRGHAGRCDPM